MPNIGSSTQSLPAEMVPKGGFAKKEARSSNPFSGGCLEGKEDKRKGGPAKLP